MDYEKAASMLQQSKPFETITLAEAKEEGADTVEFGAVVGNPPYQERDGGYGSSSMPVYHHFVQIAKASQPRLLSLIIPARWYIGGRGLESFRKSMLVDDHISKLFDYPHDKDVFPSVDVAGGICYFLRDILYKGNCTVVGYNNGRISTSKRSLDEFPTFVRDNKAVGIVRKVLSKHTGSFMDKVVYPSRPFGLRTYYKPKDKGIPCQFIQKIGLRFADPSDVKDDSKILHKWKFLVPKAPIAGQTDFTKQVRFYYKGNTFIAEPGCCCTESFLVAYAADTKEEIKCFESYLFTRVVRFLLLQSVISQDVVADKWKFIPHLGRYTEEYTDDKLMKAWSLTDEEMDYIKERIKEVE